MASNNASNASASSNKQQHEQPKVYKCGPALEFEVIATDGRARATMLRLPHGPVRTPVFMPVGTQGTIKGMTTEQMADEPIDCEILLGNTYHLGLRPGAGLLRDMGGLHKFMNWKRNILTDSGGFQMVSLLKLAEISEEGVNFQSPTDGTMLMLTPEESVRTQHKIGSDIVMVLDDVVHSCTDDPERFKVATARTVRWLDRCIAAHKSPEDPVHCGPQHQNLFGIVQGGLDVSEGGLRDQCLDAFALRDHDMPGYAIGGLAGGEDKHEFWRVVEQCARRLPDSKPRYLMGVGYPLDIVVCTALGVDMYDCVYPTRTGRFGVAFVDGDLLKLKSGKYATETGPLDDTCPCSVCNKGDASKGFYSRSAIHHLVKTEPLGSSLVTHHNIVYMLQLVRRMRVAIIEHRYADFVRTFLKAHFPKREQVPKWVHDALLSVDIRLPLTHWDDKDNNSNNGSMDVTA